VHKRSTLAEHSSYHNATCWLVQIYPRARYQPESCFTHRYIILTQSVITYKGIPALHRSGTKAVFSSDNEHFGVADFANRDDNTYVGFL
jgi:hypothetical protein